jgi:hypothetical protein
MVVEVKYIHGSVKQLQTGVGVRIIIRYIFSAKLTISAVLHPLTNFVFATFDQKPDSK